MGQVTVRDRPGKRVVRGPRPAKKTNNSHLGAKIALRAWLVGQLGDPQAINVLDCFAGGGQMWKSCYQGVGSYLGVDLVHYDDGIRRITSDSLRFLRHEEVDVRDWNLFDLDAYGLPYEHLLVLAHRIAGNPYPVGARVGIVITDGSEVVTGTNAMPAPLLRLIGMHRHTGSKVQHSHREDLIRTIALKCFEIAHLRVLDAKIQRSDAGMRMRYLAFLCESLG